MIQDFRSSVATHVAKDCSELELRNYCITVLRTVHWPETVEARLTALTASFGQTA